MRYFESLAFGYMVHYESMQQLAFHGNKREWGVILFDSGWGSGLSIKITQNDTYVPMAATLTRELFAFTMRVRRSIRYTIVGRRRRGFMCATFVYCSF